MLVPCVEVGRSEALTASKFGTVKNVGKEGTCDDFENSKHSKKMMERSVGWGRDEAAAEAMFRRTFVVVVIVVLEIRETKDASRKFRRKIFIRRR